MDALVEAAEEAIRRAVLDDGDKSRSRWHLDELVTLLGQIDRVEHAPLRARVLGMAVSVADSLQDYQEVIHLTADLTDPGAADHADFSSMLTWRCNALHRLGRHELELSEFAALAGRMEAASFCGLANQLCLRHPGALEDERWLDKLARFREVLVANGTAELAGVTLPDSVCERASVLWQAYKREARRRSEEALGSR